MLFRLRTVRWTSIALVVGLAVGLPAAADDQKASDQQPAGEQQGQAPSPEQPALKSQAPAKTGNSLADAAARIKLSQPESGGSLVISNANLQKSGGKGVISEGGGVSAASGGLYMSAMSR